MTCLGSMTFQEGLALASIFPDTGSATIAGLSWRLCTPETWTQRIVIHSSLHSVPFQGFREVIHLFLAAMVSAKGKKHRIDDPTFGVEG